MEVKDLKDKTPFDLLVVEIVEKSEPRSFHSGTLAKCRVKDSTGSVDLTLWNDDVSNYNNGDTIKIENGWVGSFQDNLQISAGKFGKITLVGKSDKKPDESTKAKADDLVDEEDMQSL